LISREAAAGDWPEAFSFHCVSVRVPEERQLLFFVDCQEHPSADRAEAGNQLGQCLGVGEKLVPGKPRQVFFVHPRYELPDRVETARHATFAGL